ncbi:FHA domain-containing protein [Chitinibacteraceae bacterium HSL-7]
MAKLLLCLDGKLIEEYRLVRDRVTVGRRATNDIQIDNLAVSGEHAVFERVGGDLFVADLGSTNGVQLNGEFVKRKLLADGDEVVIGKHMFKYFAERAAAVPMDQTMVIRPGSMRPPVAAAGAPGIPTPASATASRRAMLKVLSGSSAGRVLGLEKAITTIGRAGSDRAAVQRRGGGYVLLHVDGQAPLLVNSQPIGARSHPLTHGDRIAMAGIELVFMFEGVA